MGVTTDDEMKVSSSSTSSVQKSFGKAGVTFHAQESKLGCDSWFFAQEKRTEKQNVRCRRKPRFTCVMHALATKQIERVLEQHMKRSSKKRCRKRSQVSQRSTSYEN